MASADGGTFPWMAKDVLSDSFDKMIDLDGKTKLNLFRGGYAMGWYKDGADIMYTYKADVLIRKGPEIKKDSYDILRDFQHNYAIPLLNFHPVSNVGRLVIPKVKGSFDVWVELQGRECLFDEHGKMSRLFRNMIVNLSDLIEKLHCENIMIKNLNSKNLYMAAETTPRVLLLLTEVELCKNEVTRGGNWKSFKDIIEQCWKKCGVQLDYQASKFLRFIGSENFNVKNLKAYPFDWDYETKREYLIALIAAPQSMIRDGIKLSDVRWPLINGKLPYLLQQIVDQSERKCYQIDKPFDYAMLIRNSFKHFKELPEDVKRECGYNQEGFIKLIEKWSPNIWTDLYDSIGRI